MWKLTDSTISLGNDPIVTGVAENITIEADKAGIGCFLLLSQSQPRNRFRAALGALPGLERLTIIYRGPDPFWLIPGARTDTRDMPTNIQWLVGRRNDGLCVMIAMLFSEDMQFSLRGDSEGILQIEGDTTDAYTLSKGGLAAYMMAVPEKDYYDAMPRAAATVMRRLGAGKLRRKKSDPPFVDYFSWCTWDAFYDGVSFDLVLEGLESFRKAGVKPRGLILDDGWQQLEPHEAGQARLSGFDANEKFPGGLNALSERVKNDYGIDALLVWHAVSGYWGGTDADKLPGYRVTEVIPRGDRNTGIESVRDWQGFRMGVVHPRKARKFYDDYHSWLKSQGIDGVKVDNQGSLHYLADGLGGRVQLFKAYRKAMERSGKKHFGGTFINCMCHATELWYLCTNSNVTRTSTDFWPHRPESHGFHLYTNAQVSAWFGNFTGVDWDMFQSGHEMGAFHAAGRAVSGGPVYVSDKPDKHNADVLRKLVCSDGTVLRALDPGRPTMDCLFSDCTKEDQLLKIFNRNHHGYVVGLFNARYRPDEKGSIAGALSPSDVHGVKGNQFAVYLHNAGSLQLMKQVDRMDITLDDGTAEVATVMPLKHGAAVIGLLDKFNAGGAVSALTITRKSLRFTLQDGGQVGAYVASKPSTVTADESPVAHEWDQGTGLLSFRLTPGKHEVTVAL